MKIIFDVCYHDTFAKAAAISFEDFSSSSFIKQYTITTDIANEYESGQFYKRELPCLIKLWNSIPENERKEIDTIIVDGLYDLWDGRPGLGHHFKEWLDNEGYSIEIIGIAKKKFKDDFPSIIKVVRGNSTTPLNVNGSDKSKDYAIIVKSMYGSYRLPWLVKEVDTLSKI